MFFNLVARNSKSSRKENGIFYASLVVSIIAFYVILSLENQDVMIFLSKMESDAVSKLLALIPVLYGASLFIIFFLVYFASRYQMERRSHEFGVYLMLGMRRRRLFAMLMAEDMWSSLMSLVIGIPVAVALTEIISLVTAKLVGLGIIGHQFTLSIKAVFFTIAGFFLVKLLALAILSGKIARLEISELLTETQDEKSELPSRRSTIWNSILGVLFLTAAYCLAMGKNAWYSLLTMGSTVILGISGTFLLFRGIGAWLENMIGRQKKIKRLSVFTFRQLQENIFKRSGALAVSSLLILMALCCFGYGIAVGSTSNKAERGVDYTFTEDESTVKETLDASEAEAYIDKVFKLRTGMLYTKDGPGEESEVPVHTFNPENLVKEVENLKDSEEKDVLLNNLQYFDAPYLIPLSDYNEVLKLKGKKLLHLGANQAALYNAPQFQSARLDYEIVKALKKQPELLIDGEAFELKGKMYSDNIVADRAINISYGLIVSDEVFDKLTVKDRISTFSNAVLSNKYVEKNGLMQTIYKVNAYLDDAGLSYESYLQSMGRQLFYTVASSYTTIYLGVIFLVIANTVLSVQFLMQLRKTQRRYQTLVRLGSSSQDICHSARTQIGWYFSLSIVVAVISAVFGIRSLLFGILPTGLKGQTERLFGAAAAIIGVLCVVECIYIVSVNRISDRHILDMMHDEQT